MDYPWRDADRLRTLYHDEHLSMSAIADRLDTNAAVIHDWMGRHGIESRSRSEANTLRYDTDEPWKDEALMRELYVEKRLTQPEIADRLGCGDSNVSNWLTRLGIVLPWKDEELMRELYVDRQMSQSAIADHLDCGVSTVERWLGRHGIKGRENSVSVTLARLPEAAYEILTDEEELKRLYVDEGLRSGDICELLDVAQRTVCQYVAKYGLTRPTTGESHPGWKGGAHPYGLNWNTQRERRLDRDGHECVVCGVGEDEYRKSHGRGLDVHHVTPLRKFVDDGELNHEAANALTNLLTLCRTCHARWEGIELRPHT